MHGEQGALWFEVLNRTASAHFIGGMPIAESAAKGVVDPYQRVFGHDLEPVFESAELLVIGVNTTRAYRRKDGEVSVQQVERVVRRLEHATARQLRVVVTHQPVVAAQQVPDARPRTCD